MVPLARLRRERVRGGEKWEEGERVSGRRKGVQQERNQLTYQEAIKSIGVLIGSKLLVCMIRRRGPPHSHHAPSQKLHLIEPMRTRITQVQYTMKSISIATYFDSSTYHFPFISR